MNLIIHLLIHAIMKKPLHFLIVFSVFFASCASQRIAVLTPKISTQYLDNEGFATQKSDSLDITFGYLFSTKDHLVFEVAVKNNSDDSVLIDPELFSFQHVSLLDSNEVSPPFMAHSFSKVIDQLNDRAREANIKATIIVLAVVATAVAIDVASNKNTPTRYQDYSFTRNTTVDLSFNYFDAVVYNHLSRKAARKGLAESFMYPRKIGKSESHIGAVYFPRYDNAKELLFNFRTNNQDFKTLFKQTIRLR
jgi:hypothetical protein